jgi:hypothetical protein
MLTKVVPRCNTKRVDGPRLWRKTTSRTQSTFFQSTFFQSTFFQSTICAQALSSRLALTGCGVRSSCAK